ncbi:competence protein ComFB [Cohnella sp. CFH 77786]|uniref:late competence development ComFB family protein n=1 Tax=Cohnella sp. CFH 77786 TaxID=2662265 RepID=UPI001C610ED1|nr:late competence development ComFB family protein [Cohnella sp. CFH 77786]MBW5447990.1 competence protein ComFB [Cohnella sp. CFH 77786]
MNLKKELSVINAMEPIVIQLFEEQYLKERTLACGCDKCQLDILLLTLNQLPPRYTSSQAGEAYIKALYLNPQLQSDILKVLTQSVKVIEDNPSHP